MFTIRELQILARLIGHHVSTNFDRNGDDIGQLYDKLLRLYPSAGTEGPFAATIRHPYGARPMIDVSTNAVEEGLVITLPWHPAPAEPDLHFVGSDWFLNAADIPAGLVQALLDCARPGDAEPAVRALRDAYTVTGDPASCRDYLRGYGAWEAEELADHEQNLDRLVWLTGNELAESGEAHFSTY